MSFSEGQKWKNKTKKKLSIDILQVGENSCWIRYNENPRTDCWRKKAEITEFYFLI